MRTDNLPMVSCVIPVYNGANFLREAIDSALNQTYPNIEVIVVNDGSTDGGATEAIALSYQDRIRYYRKENGGVSSALNYGIREMKGKYFNWLSHDDIHLPQKVEKQMEAVLANEGDRPVICVCNYFLIDEKGQEFARAPEQLEPYFRRSPLCFLGGETTLMIDGDATLIDKAIFDACGGFSESLFASQETDMWFRALEVADFVFISDYLVAYRSHAQQVTNKRKKNVGLEAGNYRGGLMSQVSLQELQGYCCTANDAVRFGKAIYGYMPLYFYEVAHQMIEKQRQLMVTDWKFSHHALTGMFEQADVEQIESALRQDLSRADHKTKILVYCGEWADKQLMVRLNQFMDQLQNEFEFIIAYYGEPRYAFSQNATAVCFRRDAGWSTVDRGNRLALIAELFQVDILWINAINFLPEANALSYLKQSKIRSIVSFHYLEPDLTALDFVSNDEESWNAMADATILTHEQHENTFTQYIYPYDAVFLPNPCADRAATETWKKFFLCVQSAGQNPEEISLQFPLIESKQSNVQPTEILQKIQPYLKKYEEMAMERCRIKYEQSIYWRITKPFRMACDLIRRIAK